MNGRICRACGRRLNADEHDIGEPRTILVRRGRGRVGMQRARTYACRVRLAATSPSTGKTFVPPTADRFEPTLASYRHESRFDATETR